MWIRNWKNVIFLLLILTKSCCLNDLIRQGQFVPSTYLPGACLNGAVLCRRPACLPFLGCSSFCLVVCNRGDAVCPLATAVSVWLGCRKFVRLGQFALVSVGVYARLVVSLYCPCLSRIGLELLTSRDAICIIFTFSRLPPGPTYFTSSVTYPLLPF